MHVPRSVPHSSDGARFRMALRSWMALRAPLFLLTTLATAPACSTHHWAQVEQSPLPTPPGEKVLHSSRLLVSVVPESEQTQCVAYEKHHPVCFYNLKQALAEGLTRALWPSFPEVVVGSEKEIREGDYVLQVQVTLDALPPDDAGPGWSAGARSRFRLLRGEDVLAEQTLASRSRAHFPYGAPLGQGATEVVDATVIHIAQIVSEVPEEHPEKPVPLPRVAAVDIQRKGGDSYPKSSPADASDKPPTGADMPAPSNAKTEIPQTADEGPPPPPEPGPTALNSRR